MHEEGRLTMTVSVLIGTSAPYKSHTVYDDLEMATALVAYLSDRDEDGWNYLLTKTSDGKSAVVEIYDETGYFLGLL
jgi:hypothetical protein